MKVKDILSDLYKVDDLISKSETKKDALNVIAEIITKYEAYKENI